MIPLDRPVTAIQLATDEAKLPHLTKAPVKEEAASSSVAPALATGPQVQEGVAPCKNNCGFMCLGNRGHEYCCDRCMYEPGKHGPKCKHVKVEEYTGPMEGQVAEKPIERPAPVVEEQRDRPT